MVLVNNVIAEGRGAMRSGNDYVYHIEQTLEEAEQAAENFEDAAAAAEDDLGLYIEEAGVGTADAVRYAEGVRNAGCTSAKPTQRF